ncbi:GatB/YqeY domain-containing protein [soil metagenome]
MASSEQIETDLRTAMKARDPETVATLRMVLAAIKNARVSAGRSGDVSDAEVTDILAKQGKQRSEAAAAYRDGGRDELADKEERELAIIQRYLPAALDDDELAAIVDQAVAETGASGPGDLGAVMSAVMPKVKGRADGKRVNAMVRARLQG